MWKERTQFLGSVVWNGSLSLGWMCLFSVSLFLPAVRVDRQMKLFLSYAGRQNILCWRHETTLTVLNNVCHYYLMFVHLRWELWSKLSDTSVTIFTTCRNVLKHCVLSTRCICVFHMILRRNCDFLNRIGPLGAHCVLNELGTGLINVVWNCWVITSILDRIFL